MAAVRLPWGPRRNKYGNRRIRTAAGVSFDSQSEQRRWHELQLLERTGEICNLVLHPRFSLAVNGHHICDYVADYGYQSRQKNSAGIWSWVEVVEDHKAGAITQTHVFRLKQKLLKAIYDIDILITGESN
jgi:hypothetical protein